MLLKSSIRVIGRLPVRAQILDIALAGLLHGERGGSLKPRSRARSPVPYLARPVLRLLEIQDVRSVGVREVISRLDHLDLVGLLAFVEPHDPFARSFERLAVAKMQPRVDHAVIGLAAALELVAGRPGIELGSLELAPHKAPPLVVSNRRPIYVRARPCTSALSNSMF